MMEDYISKGDAYIELMKCKDFDTDRLYHGNHYLKIACDVVRSIPSADVVERKKGKWIWDDEGYHCSECWFHAHGNTLECMDGTYKYCPSCGAEMECE